MHPPMAKHVNKFREWAFRIELFVATFYKKMLTKRYVIVYNIINYSF